MLPSSLCRRTRSGSIGHETGQLRILEQRFDCAEQQLLLGGETNEKKARGIGEGQIAHGFNLVNC
jgi:hypothetical protein